MKNWFLKYFIITFFVSITFTKSCFAGFIGFAYDSLKDYILYTKYNVEYDQQSHSTKFSSALKKSKDKEDIKENIKDDYFHNVSNIYCQIIFRTDLAVPGGDPARLVQKTRANNRYMYEEGGKKKYVLTVCGSDWLTWGNQEVVEEIEKNGGCGAEANACNKYTEIKDYYPELGAFNGSYKYEVLKCLNNKNDCANIQCKNKKGNTCIPFGNDIGNFTINDKIYRENLYDGEEIAVGDCKDPRPEALKYDVNANLESGQSPRQLYYFRGLKSANYACDRFLFYRKNVGDEFDEAYNCCKEASKNICIKHNQKSMFALCSPKAKNQKCKIDDIELLIKESIDESDNTVYYCASTYNLCPYNFNIGSGTEQAHIFERKIKNEEKYEECLNSSQEEYCDFTFEDDCIKSKKTDEKTKETTYEFYKTCYGKIKNFSQYRRHCTIIEDEKYNELVLTNSYSPFLDKACINFVGSSHNTYEYASYSGYDRLPFLYKFSLSAPAVECFTETMKNFLFNRAGHTKCKNAELMPDENEECSDGNYKYKIGQVITEYDDADHERPLNKLIKFIHNSVMVAASLMITLYGYNVLFKGGKLGGRGDFIIMMLKIAVVVTLINSTFWYDMLFNFTYSLSETFSNAVSKIGFETTVDQNGNFIKDDGCFFGNVNDIISSNATAEVQEAVQKYNDNRYDKYPAGRKYIAFFDTLDCKMAKYFGYRDVKTGSGNLGSFFGLIGSALIWPFSIIIYIAISSILIALLLFNFIIKVVYFFAGATIAMTMLLFLSPLIIPTILFDKTKKIFDKWLKNLLGFALQPMILVAYISISIMIIDNFTLGDGVFTGSAPYKNLVCGYICKDKKTGSIKAYTNNNYGVEETIKDAEKETDATKRAEKLNKVFINVSTNGCTLGENDEITKIKRNSVLCFINNVTTERGWFFGIPRIVDIFTNDITTFLRLTFLLFILNNLLNTIPGIASVLTGGSGVPGSSVSADPFTIAGKIGSFVKGVKRLAAKAIFKLSGSIGKGVGDLYKKHQAKKNGQTKNK